MFGAIGKNHIKNDDTDNINNNNTDDLDMQLHTEQELEKKICCRFCLKQFLYVKNLNKHVREERCEVLKLQKQQKENNFINLLEEKKIDITIQMYNSYFCVNMEKLKFFLFGP